MSPCEPVERASRFPFGALALLGTLSSLPPAWGIDPDNSREVARLLVQLRHPHPDERAEAADYFSQHRVLRAIPVLIELLERDEVVRVRTSAANALASQGKLAEPAIPALLDAMSRDHSTWPTVCARSV